MICFKNHCFYFSMSNYLATKPSAWASLVLVFVSQPLPKHHDNANCMSTFLGRSYTSFFRCFPMCLYKCYREINQTFLFHSVDRWGAPLLSGSRFIDTQLLIDVSEGVKCESIYQISHLLHTFLSPKHLSTTCSLFPILFLTFLPNRKVGQPYENIPWICGGCFAGKNNRGKPSVYLYCNFDIWCDICW